MQVSENTSSLIMFVNSNVCKYELKINFVAETSVNDNIQSISQHQTY